MTIAQLVSAFLHFTRLELLPVRVRAGFARGARWSIFPYSSYWRGTHEPDTHRYLTRTFNRPGEVFWDVGAHWGIYAIGAARVTGPTGQVAAFEPNPRTFARLQLHCRRNRLTNLKLFPFAASDVAGEAPLLAYGNWEHTSTHLPYDGETATAASTPLSVPTVRLDDLVARGDVRPPHFIKLDAEGHGHHVLAGARATIIRHRPRLLIGFHSAREKADCLAFLLPLGYQGHHLEGDTLVPVTEFGYSDYIFLPATPPLDPGRLTSR